MAKISRVDASAARIIGVPLFVMLLSGGTALAAPSPGQICAAAKQKATGLKAMAKLTCYSQYTKSGGSSDLTTCLQKAESKFGTAFQKAEFTKKGSPRGCATSGDATAIESLVDDFVGAVATALPAAPIATSTPTATATSIPTSTPTSSLKNDGASCTSSAECLNSHCLPDDSNTSTTVCCATSCANTGAASCGDDGNCKHDGSACALYSTATMCQALSCSGGSLTAAANCNGIGACNSSPPAACPNNLGCAGPTSCATSCTPATTINCASSITTTCNAAGTACLLNSGQPCVGNGQCLSNVCSGGACQ